MICQVSLGVKLFFNFHLIQQISRSGIFVHDEENVADVDNDTALVIGRYWMSPPTPFQLRSKSIPINSPSAFITGLPEFPPVEWVVVLKATGIFPSEVL